MTTPQYRRPAHPRVLENPLTLHGLNEASLNAAREASEAALLRGEEQALGVLIGGPSGTYTLGPKGARRLLAEAQALAGSRPLWVTTSPRTPSAAVARLAAHPWRPQDRFLPWGSGTNPYRGILARAGALLVTETALPCSRRPSVPGKWFGYLTWGIWLTGDRDGPGIARCKALPIAPSFTLDPSA